MITQSPAVNVRLYRSDFRKAQAFAAWGIIQIGCFEKCRPLQRGSSEYRFIFVKGGCSKQGEENNDGYNKITYNLAEIVEKQTQDGEWHLDRSF